MKKEADRQGDEGACRSCVCIRRVALVGVGLAVGLFIAEGVVRLFEFVPEIRIIDTSDPDSAYKRSDNPILGYEIKANYRNTNAGFISAFARSNSHGQRDVERSIEKSPGVRRVILLGDSVVESMEVPDIERVMHRQLERLYPDNSIEVLNFGVNGYCTLSEIELLRVKGLAFKPDVVIVVFVENDFNSFNAAAHALATRAKRPAMIDGLFKGSHLFRSICLRLNLFHFAADENPVQWNADAIGGNNVLTGLTMLKKMADEEGFKPVIAIWPQFLEKGITDGPSAGPDDSALVIERLAGFHGIPSFRLSEFFAQDHAARGASVGPSGTYTIGDGMHVNEEGSRVAALALKAVLAFLDDPRRVVVRPSEEEYAKALSVVMATEEEQMRHAKLRFVAVDELVSIGNSLMKQELPLEAIPIYRRALLLKPDFAGAHHNLGLALSAAGRLQESVESFQAALQLEPDTVQSHSDLGIALHRLGRVDEAIRHFELAVKLAPDDPAVRQNLRIARETKKGE